jgi:ADP-ribosylation factor-like protein 2
MDPIEIQEVCEKDEVDESKHNANYKKGLQLRAIKTHTWNIIRCSAMTGQNLEQGLEWVVEDAKKRLFLY